MKDSNKNNKDQQQTRVEEALNNRQQTINNAKAALSNDDVSAAVSNLLEIVQVQDQVIGMLVHDLMVMSQRSEMNEAAQIQTAGTVRIALEALKDKFAEVNVEVTDEYLQELWETKVLPDLKELQEARQKISAAKEKEKSNLVLPDEPKIIVPR